MTDMAKTTKGNNTVERVYEYVRKYIHDNGMSPSVRDICLGVGLKSTSSVHTYLKKLDEIGKIEYRPGLRRAIIIKDTQDDSVEESAIVSDLTSPVSTDTVKLNCIGKITAGVPIYAHEDNTESFYVNKSIIGSSDAFILKVKGTSMINAHILDGDYIIVRKQNTCNEGDIIAALIGDEATVKRFGHKDGVPYLFPENDLYSPIPFNTEDCKILGKVVGLHRYSI
ncbi:MAG: transcriptional repressor LexA [Clostridia bacterium]|nr:transcriptional repressor LexA [Clostridia bacterium]